MDRITSISTVAFYGYSLEVALETIVRAGATDAEITFSKGYPDPVLEEISGGKLV